MPDPFPDFEEPISLPDGGSWTAVCESFDQRTDAAYYCITRRAADGSETELWAKTFCPDPPTREWLLPQIQAVAVAGESDTDYRGWNRPRDRG